MVESCYCQKDVLVWKKCMFYCSSWGNLLTSALSKAVDKAMESDVEYRRGLPVNLASFMGSGVVGISNNECNCQENNHTIQMKILDLKLPLHWKLKFSSLMLFLKSSRFVFVEILFTDFWLNLSPRIKVLEAIPKRVFFKAIAKNEIAA